MKLAAIAEKASGSIWQKIEENRPPLKFNFKGGLFSSLLLSDVPFMYFLRSRQISCLSETNKRYLTKKC